ncbi:MAG TPA: hypothetical protein VIL20_15000 [Sandaracinaceae bacterium]
MSARGITPMLLALALGCGLGCGGPSFAGNVFRDGEAAYRVGELDPGWRRIAMEDNDLAWHNERIGAVAQVNASCDPADDVPLGALTNHLLIGFTDRELRSSQTVPLDGREALRSHLVARLDGVPRELLLYVLKKDRCTYDFALIAPPGDAFREAEPAFERLVAGFTTEVGRP